jgi:hypothetical protein
MQRSSTAYAIIILTSALSFILFKDARAADLLASWVAGHFYQIGALDQIYPSDTTVYSMHPPDAWLPYLSEQGYNGQVFPFIYPPLWAHFFRLADNRNHIRNCFALGAGNQPCFDGGHAAFGKADIR